MALRLPALALLIFGLLPVLLLMRGLERPIYGARRPVSPAIVRFASRNALRILGLRLRVRGRSTPAPGAIVANHSSWLDIFVLNASEDLFFVAKAEVARWPGIGWAARAAGTLFIRRNRRDAQIQQRALEARLREGHHLCVFPEGTSTDGQQVLAFKSTLFSAFLSPDLPEGLRIQPVSVIYHPPVGADPRLYGWWGEMDFARHMIRVMAQRRRGLVEVLYHPALQVSEMPDRKMLARRSEQAVRTGHAQARQAAG